ncbi:hypothetical protein FHU29_002575 [Hoyosella altamirensis]|uniref:Uncharacterized protein n=1 Tax=Hoyosella altamirensis TaxID=616997 RepID=A0A839RQ14_9ACTN|nr:hypothetical protein [Hoyosella altamirensis]
MHPVGLRQRLEVLLGFLSFFTAIAFFSAVAVIFRGDVALGPSVVLLVCVTLLWFTYRKWRRVREPARAPDTLNPDHTPLVGGSWSGQRVCGRRGSVHPRADPAG